MKRLPSRYAWSTCSKQRVKVNTEQDLLIWLRYETISTQNIEAKLTDTWVLFLAELRIFDN